MESSGRIVEYTVFSHLGIMNSFVICLSAFSVFFSVFLVLCAYMEILCGFDPSDPT